MFSSLRAYRSSIILLGALLLGGLFGGLVPELAIKLKPIGQIFLNLLSVSYTHLTLPTNREV